MKKKKTRWLFIFLYNVRWKISGEINKEYSFILFWSSTLKITRLNLNNRLDKILCITTYLQYKKVYEWRFSNFYRYEYYNTYEKPHCSLIPKLSSDKKLNTLALVKTHSDKLIDNNTKKEIQPFMVETNLEKKGLRNKFTYMAMLPEKKIRDEECSNSFKLNNKMENFLLEETWKKNNIIKTKFMFKEENQFLFHDGNRPTIGDLDSKRNWNYATTKFINEDVKIAREELNNITNIELKELSQKEKNDATEIVINRISNLSREEFLNSVQQGAREMEDEIILQEIQYIKENFEDK